MSKKSGNHVQKESGGRSALYIGLAFLNLAALAGILVVLTVSVWNQRSIDRTQSDIESRLTKIEGLLDQVSGKIGNVAALARPPRRGPDPNRVYTINTVGAPVLGPPAAPITIAEFSDFQ